MHSTLVGPVDPDLESLPAVLRYLELRRAQPVVVIGAIASLEE